MRHQGDEVLNAVWAHSRKLSKRHMRKWIMSMRVCVYLYSCIYNIFVSIGNIYIQYKRLSIFYIIIHSDLKIYYANMWLYTVYSCSYMIYNTYNIKCERGGRLNFKSSHLIRIAVLNVTANIMRCVCLCWSKRNLVEISEQGEKHICVNVSLCVCVCVSL